MAPRKVAAAVVDGVEKPKRTRKPSKKKAVVSVEAPVEAQVEAQVEAPVEAPVVSVEAPVVPVEQPASHEVQLETSPDVQRLVETVRQRLSIPFNVEEIIAEIFQRNEESTDLHTHIQKVLPNLHINEFDGVADESDYQSLGIYYMPDQCLTSQEAMDDHVKRLAEHELVAFIDFIETTQLGLYSSPYAASEFAFNALLMYHPHCIKLDKALRMACEYSDFEKIDDLLAKLAKANLLVPGNYSWLLLEQPRNKTAFFYVCYKVMSCFQTSPFTEERFSKCDNMSKLNEYTLDVLNTLDEGGDDGYVHINNLKRTTIVLKHRQDCKASEQSLSLSLEQRLDKCREKQMLNRKLVQTPQTEIDLTLNRPTTIPLEASSRNNLPQPHDKCSKCKLLKFKHEVDSSSIDNNSVVVDVDVALTKLMEMTNEWIRTGTRQVLPQCKEEPYKRTVDDLFNCIRLPMVISSPLPIEAEHPQTTPFAQLGMKEKHVEAFMKTAFNFAACSTVQHLQHGAICVKDDTVISIGYNSTTLSGNSNEDVIHAESICITKLAQNDGVGSKGSIMFCTHAPCFDCSKLIYQAGIRAVVYAQECRSNEGTNFLRRCNVEVLQYVKSMV